MTDAPTILIDGRPLSEMTDGEKDALILDLAQERDALAALLPGSSHGFTRVRSFVDPAVSWEEFRAMKKQRTDPL